MERITERVHDKDSAFVDIVIGHQIMVFQRFLPDCRLEIQYGAHFHLFKQSGQAVNLVSFPRYTLLLDYGPLDADIAHITELQFSGSAFRPPSAETWLVITTA